MPLKKKTKLISCNIDCKIQQRHCKVKNVHCTISDGIYHFHVTHKAIIPGMAGLWNLPNITELANDRAAVQLQGLQTLTTILPCLIQK